MLKSTLFAAALVLPVLTLSAAEPASARGNGQSLSHDVAVQDMPANRAAHRKALQERAAARASDPLPDRFEFSGDDGPSNGLPLLAFALLGLALTYRRATASEAA